MTDKEKIERLEKKVKELEDRLDKLTLNILNVPTRFEFDSIARCQNTGSFWDIF